MEVQSRVMYPTVPYIWRYFYSDIVHLLTLYHTQEKSSKDCPVAQINEV